MQTFNSLNGAEKEQVRILQGKWGGTLESVARTFVQTRERMRQQSGDGQRFSDSGTVRGVDAGSVTLTAAEEASVQRMARELGKSVDDVRQSYTDIKQRRAQGGPLLMTSEDYDTLTFSDAEIEAHLQAHPAAREVYTRKAQETGKTLRDIATQQMRLNARGAFGGR